MLLGLPEVLGSTEKWPLAFSFPGILAFFLVCILPFCPESPKFNLITRGKRDIAFRDLERLVEPRDARDMFESIIKETAILQVYFIIYIKKLCFFFIF